MTIDLKAITEFANTVTVVIMFTIIIATGARKIWVWGYQLADAVRDRDFWRGIALRSMNIAEQTMYDIDSSSTKVS